MNRLVRLNTNGTIDASFGTGFNNIVHSMVVQPDGKIIVAGVFTTYQGAMVGNFLRLNADGSRDTGFVTGSGFTGSNVFGPQLALQPDGKLIAGGNFTGYNGSPRNGLVRLNANGSVDATFVTGSGFVGAVNAVAVQANGKVLVGGDFTAYNGTTGQNRLIRLNADGTRDATFVTGAGLNATVWNLTVQPDGNVLAAGAFTAYDGSTGLNGLVRLTAAGARDAAFATGTGFGYTGNAFTGALYTTAVQANGQVLAGGDFTAYNGTPANNLARLTTTGAFDATPKPVAGATFTFTPGNSTANPLVTSTAGNYTATASLNGETSPASNSITLTACPAPTITSFTPTTGETGTIVTVTGTNLSFATGASVNGTAGSTLTNNTGTSLTFTVGAGSTTGPVRVTTPGGTATGGTFTVNPVSITSISPNSGITGTVVVITGTNLLGATAVRVNGVSQSGFVVNSSTQITFTVNAAATTGPVSIVMPGGAIYTGGTFTVDPVTITSISPNSGAVGTEVVITGTNLTGASAVRINSVLQTGFVVNSPTQITFTVAAGTNTGAVRVTKSGVVYTGDVFTLVPSAISGFAPASGPAGTLVTITGTSLDVVQGVRFGTSGLALFTAQSATSLTVVVPTDAATGTLTLTPGIGSVLTSTGTFTYTPRPAGLVASLSPAGPLGPCTSHTLTASAVSPAFGTGTGLNNQVNSVVTQTDGKVLVGGNFTTYNGTPNQNRLIRLNADGSRDATFTIGTGTGAGFNAAVNAVAVQADGKVLVGGNFTSYNGTLNQNRLIRLLADGTRDATFVTGGGFSFDVNCVVVQPDGQILVGGDFSQYNGVVASRVARLNPDGSRDATFSGSAGSTTVNALALQADGKVLVGRDYSGSTPIFRLNADGTRDLTFTSAPLDGGVYCVAVQPDGKVLVGGSFTRYNNLIQKGITRMSATGSPETSFGTGYGSGFSNGANFVRVNALTLQPDGKIVVVGDFTSYNGTPAGRLIRLTATGNPDASLATGGGFDNIARCVAVQADGNLVVGGDFTAYNTTPATRLIRLKPDGSVNNAATAVPGATFTFAPGNTTTNPLVTSTAGDYSAVASLNGETSAASNAVQITACPLPVISSFSPTSGPVGTSVTITGTDLDAATSVSFNGTAATILTNTATSITAAVPAGASTGPISVTTSYGTDSSTGDFTVVQPPALTSLSPADGLPGDIITISGTSLDGATAVDFGGTAATVLTNTATSITVAVPAGTSTGNVTVTTAAGTSNGLLFTVLGDLVVSGTQNIQGNYRNVTITGTGVVGLSGPLMVRGALLVQPNGRLSTNNYDVTGSGSFALSRRASLVLFDAAGISVSGASGDIQVSGPRYFSPDGRYFYNGSANQVSGPGLPGQVNELQSFSAHTFTLSQPVAIRHLLAMGLGTTFSPAPGMVTLLSDADSTASIDYRTNYAYPGTYTVQRHVKGDLYAGSAYRHVSAPVAGATVGSLAVAGGFQPAVNAAYNTSATPLFTGSFPTVFGYDETRLATATNNLDPFSKGWESPAALGASLGAGLGYTVHMAANQTMSFDGPLSSGLVALPLTRGASADAGWALVGNPFAAPFDLSSLANTAGVDDAKYVFEATGPYVGSYRTYLPSGPAFGNPMVALAQGFFTRVSAANSSATLTLNSDDTAVGDPTVFHRTTADTRPLLTLALTNATRTLTDETSLYLQAGIPAGVDGRFDAAKLVNPNGLNLAQVAAGQQLAINGLPALTAATVIPLAVAVPAAGTYTISVARLLNLPAGTTAVLVDALTGTRLSLATLPAAGYAFTTTAGALNANGRFFLNLTPAAALATAAEVLATNVTLYPNPARHTAAVLVPAVAGATQVQLTLLNVLGQVVLARTAALPATGAALTLDVAGLARGVYTLRLAAGGTAATRRLVLD